MLTLILNTKYQNQKEVLIDIDVNANIKAPKAKGSADIDGKGIHFPKFGIGFGGKAKGEINIDGKHKGDVKAKAHKSKGSADVDIDGKAKGDFKVPKEKGIDVDVDGKPEKPKQKNPN